MGGFDALSSQSGSTGFDRGVPFELATRPVLQDVGSVVTLPSDSADGWNGDG